MSRNPKRAELSLSLDAVLLRLIADNFRKKSEPSSAQRLERLMARPGIVAQEALRPSVFFPGTSTVQNSDLALLFGSVTEAFTEA